MIEKEVCEESVVEQCAEFEVNNCEAVEEEVCKEVTRTTCTPTNRTVVDVDIGRYNYKVIKRGYRRSSAATRCGPARRWPASSATPWRRRSARSCPATGRATAHPPGQLLISCSFILLHADAKTATENLLQDLKIVLKHPHVQSRPVPTPLPPMH